MTKTLAPLIVSLCFCLPVWAEKNVACVGGDLKHELRNAARDIQIQIPEVLKAVRIKVQIPDIQVQIPEIRVLQLPPIELQIPVSVQIPIQIPAIRVQIPKIDVRIPELPE